MKKRTLGTALFFCLAALGLLAFAKPKTAAAGEVPVGNSAMYVGLEVPGGELYLGDDEGLYYVQSTNQVTHDYTSNWNVHYYSGTLHLRNYHGGAIRMLFGHSTSLTLQVLLEGSNSITMTGTLGFGANSLSMTIESVNSSNGTLDIKVENTEAAYSAGIDNCYGASNEKTITIKSNAAVRINTAGRRSYGIISGGKVSVEGTAALDVNAIYNSAGTSDSFSAAVYSMNGRMEINTTGAVNLSAASRSVSLSTNYGYAFYSGGGSSSSYFSCAVKSFPYVSLSSVGYKSKISNIGSVTSDSYSGLIKTYKSSGTFESLLLEKTSGELPITGGTFPDPSFRSFIRNRYDTNIDGFLSSSEISYMKTITVTDETDSSLYGDAYSLAGIEYMTALTDVTWDPYASGPEGTRGNLVELDLRHNEALKTATVKNCRLRELYVNGLSRLTWLDCSHNFLHGPLAGSLPALTDLILRDNMLTELNVSGAPKLDYLDCRINSLGTLDLSANPKLRFLYCDDNSLSALDLTKQTVLEDLTCGGNLFTTLSLTKNTALRWLVVEDSKLTSLNVSKNTALTTLYCSRSDSLKTLTLGTNPNLKWLNCYGSPNLAAINISSCSRLKAAATSGNRLSASVDDYSIMRYFVEDEYNNYECCIDADPGTNLFYSVTGTTYSKPGVDQYFTAFATCGSPGSLSYQWQYRTSSSGTWKDCSSAMEGYRLATMTVPATLGRNGYQYRCKVTNSYGRTGYSPAATLYVIGVQSHPASVSTVTGKSVSFKVTATGGGLKYQWQYKYPGESWKNSGYASAKTAELTFTTVQKYNGLQYRCKVTDAAGNSVYSNTALLSVLKQQPVSASAKVGASVSFTAVGYGTGLKYQWQYKYPGEEWKNSGFTSGKTSKLTFTAQAKYNGLQYRCLITDANGTTVRSKTVKLTILPAITQQPKSTTAAANTTAKFTVKATGAGLKYQWQYQYPNESWKNSGYSSAKTATLEVPALAKYNGLKYRCIITDANGATLTSSAVTLTVR